MFPSVFPNLFDEGMHWEEWAPTQPTDIDEDLEEEPIDEENEEEQPEIEPDDPVPGPVPDVKTDEPEE